MLPLFDMMLAAQNGEAMDSIARQFGLANEQVAKAMAALVPAFSTGLKRQASDPYGFAKLMNSAMTGNYAQYFEDLGKAFTPQGISAGNSLLGDIFGSKDVSRAVAEQAARMTGLGQDMMRQFLPVMASMMMGGLAKQMTGQMTGGFPGADYLSGKPQMEMIDQWLTATGLKPKPKAPDFDLFDNPFTRSFTAMMSGKMPEAEQPANPFAGNPFVDMMDSFAKAFSAGSQAPAKAPEPAPADKTADPAAYGDMINALFDSGLEVQKNYQKTMDSIFDTYLSAMQGKDKA